MQKGSIRNSCGNGKNRSTDN